MEGLLQIVNTMDYVLSYCIHAVKQTEPDLYSLCLFSEYKLDACFSNYFVGGAEENLTVYLNRSVCFIGSAEKSN